MSMAKFLPIMLALCSMRLYTHYAQNYAGIIDAGLAFTKGKNQLSALEIEETRTIANVRIHVERVIGNVRQKYPILQNTLPIHFIHKRDREDTPLVDRIVRVCCALVNVCDSVVPYD